MNKWLILAGMLAVVASGCDSASVSQTTIESIAPENKATVTYNVAGMT